VVIDNVHLLGPSPSACGGFADIWMCERIHNGRTDHVGVKIMRCNDAANVERYKKIMKRLFRELRVWQVLRHPHVLPFYGVCDVDNPFPGLVSPWMANGHVAKYLTDHLPNITISDRLSLLSQAASGLQYLHERDPPMVHGDLKAANVLVDDQGQACLADFGLSRLLESTVTPSTATSTFAGSIRWMAPELFAFEVEPRAQLSLDTDIYSFGQLMLEVLGGHLPYHNLKSDAEVLLAIDKSKLPLRPNCADQLEQCDLPTCATICDPHWEYMNVCWSVVPTTRPKIADVRAQLEQFKTV